MFNVCIDAPKGSSYYPQNIILQFYICYHKTTMLLEYYLKNYATCMFDRQWKLTWISGSQPVTDCPQSVGSWTLFYHKSIMSQIFIEDSGNLKNEKSINNTTTSYLVSCRVIPRPAAVKGLEKEMFWKIRALGNLKCNKSNNLKSR